MNRQQNNMLLLELYSADKALPAKEGRYLVYLLGVEDPVFSSFTKEKGFDIVDVVFWGSIPKQEIRRS